MQIYYILSCYTNDSGSQKSKHLDRTRSKRSSLTGITKLYLLLSDSGSIIWKENAQVFYWLAKITDLPNVDGFTSVCLSVVFAADVRSTSSSPDWNCTDLLTSSIIVIMHYGNQYFHSLLVFIVSCIYKTLNISGLNAENRCCVHLEWRRHMVKARLTTLVMQNLHRLAGMDPETHQRK